MASDPAAADRLLHGLKEYSQHRSTLAGQEQQPGRRDGIVQYDGVDPAPVLRLSSVWPPHVARSVSRWSEPTRPLPVHHASRPLRAEPGAVRCCAWSINCRRWCCDARRGAKSLAVTADCPSRHRRRPVMRVRQFLAAIPW
jgi:hypothetical protein